jgi:WbqC-like protein family
MQSNYIPWKGYFDLIAMVDELILLDDVQYTKRDWRNRNRIKTPAGPRWLTIPVRRAPLGQRIDETEVADPGWASRHWRALQGNYARAPFFEEVSAVLEPIYLGFGEQLLSNVNRLLIEAVCGMLGVRTRLRWSTDYGPTPTGRNERLIDLCRQAGATRYLTVPGTRAYLDEGAFEKAGIAVDWMDYSGYPEYPQLHGAFEHRVSVLDLLMSTGGEAPRYLKSGSIRGRGDPSSLSASPPCPARSTPRPPRCPP